MEFDNINNIKSPKTFAMPEYPFFNRLRGMSNAPDKLKGSQIPLLARILSIADVYDAIASDRAYRRRMDETVITSYSIHYTKLYEP